MITFYICQSRVIQLTHDVTIVYQATNEKKKKEKKKKEKGLRLKLEKDIQVILCAQWLACL